MNCLHSTTVGGGGGDTSCMQPVNHVVARVEQPAAASGVRSGCDGKRRPLSGSWGLSERELAQKHDKILSTSDS